MNTHAWLLLVTLSILWGGSFFFAEIALTQLGPFTIVFARVSIAAAALMFYLRMTGKRLPSDAGSLVALLVMGGLNNALPFSLIVWGQIYLDSGVASILNASTPLFTVLLAHFLTRDERLTSNKITGVCIGIVGVGVLIGPDAIAGIGDNLLAQMAVLCAACSYAIASIYGRRLRVLPTSVAATGMLAGSSVLLLPLAIVFESPFAVMPTWDVWLAVVGVALLSSALAYAIYFRILALAGATNLMLVTFLIPVSALLLGVFVLGEEISASAYAGMMVIFIGLAWIDGRLLKLRFTINRARQTTPRSHRR
jgi:drug/metabolite transporter (DMT)-like permease